MNADTARRISARRAFRASGAPRPIIVGSVFVTLGETTLGGSPASRGIVTCLAEADERGARYEVRMHGGRKGIMYGSVMQAV
jgi:hypothetical protein